MTVTQFDMKDQAHECAVCRRSYTDSEGGVEGLFGVIPVCFCPERFSCMCDMVRQYMEGEWCLEGDSSD
jgi:hypothetical protein